MDNVPIRDPLKGPLPPPPLVPIPKKAFKGLFVTKKGFLRGLPPPNYKALKDPLYVPLFKGPFLGQYSLYTIQLLFYPFLEAFLRAFNREHCPKW